MNTPLNINLDDTAAARNLAVYLPKIYQGAPYDQTIKVKARDTGVYRDFTSYDEIIMQCVVEQNQPVILTLTRSSGSIAVTEDSISLRFPGLATAGVKVPVVNKNAINELRFLHTIILLQNGVEVERFAQGYGYIVARIAGPQ